jgi:hypothetical protein
MKAARIQVLAVYAVVFVLGHSASGQQGEAERLITEASWFGGWNRRRASGKREATGEH